MELTLVIPTYNEAENLGRVIGEWHEALKQCLPACQFVMLVIDDGSTDGTGKVLEEMGRIYPELSVHSQANRGHGQACLEGYRRAAALGSAFTMQIDSDGQCDPVFFSRFWERRGEIAVYGRRYGRGDGLFRKGISLCLRWTLFIVARTRLHDANVPYRIYPTVWAAETAGQIPPTFDLANIAVALILEPRGSEEIPIHFRKRSGGNASVRWIGFARKAFRLLKDIRSLEVSPA